MRDKISKVDWPLVVVPILAILLVSYLIDKFPQSTRHELTIIRSFFNNQLTVVYVFIGVFFLLSTIFVAGSKIGRIKLGGAITTPQYSNLRWGIMIFTSTMSADIIFYSLCEWMMYVREPFIQSKGNVMEWSLTYSFFHWGPIAWSFYIMLAVAFGYMLYVKGNRRQKFSEACRPLLGHWTDGIPGKLIDLVAIFALLAGTATTFSMSMPLLSTAVGQLFGIHPENSLSLVLICVVVIIYLTASVMGMRAISRLSVLCYVCFAGLLLYVLLFSGSFHYILGNGLTSIGNLIVHFPKMATTVHSQGFTQNWTIYYWSYWIVWCVATPFFIGSISAGRTIRDVVIRGYLWGLGGTFLSFMILANFGMSRQIDHLVSATYLLAHNHNYSQVALAIMKTLPDYSLALILLSLSMIGLYSTVFDSITMVIAKYSYRNLALEEEPSKLMRTFWAIAFMILPIALLVSDSNVNNIQSVAIIAALPTMVVMVLIVISFYVSVLRNYREKRRTRK